VYAVSGKNNIREEALNCAPGAPYAPQEV